MYEEFAGVYDELMEEIPYAEWVERICGFLIEKGVSSGVICELGCGTGSVTELLAKAGYQMIGVELSEDMLALAENKREKSGQNILYLHQDMTELTLAEPVDAFVSVCDSMNYLLTETALDKVLANVRKYLRAGGWLIFDCKTEYCYRHVMGNRTMVDETEDVTCIWDNVYDRDKRINEYLVTVFRKCLGSDLYERFDEVHRQRAYLPEELERHLVANGFTNICCFDETMKKDQTEQSERIYYCAQIR